MKYFVNLRDINCFNKTHSMQHLLEQVPQIGSIIQNVYQTRKKSSNAFPVYVILQMKSSAYHTCKSNKSISNCIYYKCKYLYPCCFSVNVAHDMCYYPTLPYYACEVINGNPPLGFEHQDHQNKGVDDKPTELSLPPIC